MPAVAKKKVHDLHKGIQLPFRVDDPRLVEAIEKYAEDSRRSRNMTIVVLIEQALTALNRWPPKPDK